MVINVYENYRNESNACNILNIATTNGIWPGKNPLIEPLPLLIMQLALIIFITRSLHIIFRPLHQPRLVTDILGGLLLGPSFFGRKSSYFSKLFPVRTVMTLETVAYMALDLYIFLIGLGMDLNSVKRSTKRELTIAASGALVPMVVGAGLFFLTAHQLHIPTDPSGCLFWGLMLTVTGFPTVTQILEEVNLLNTDIGRVAMSTAMINDVCSWILVSIVLPILLNPKNASAAITSTVAFILVCIYAVRPGLVRIIRHSSEGKDQCYSHHYLCFILIGVVICSFVTEVTGAHSIVGAFVFGLIMPRELGSLLVESFGDFVSGIMLPIFFAICGIRINVHAVHNWFLAGFIIITTCSCKILSTLLVSHFYPVPFQDSFALGVLMNTKGILAIVLLNLGWDKKVLHDQEYAVIVAAIVIMTGGVAPIIGAIYGTPTRQIKSKGRSVQHTEQDAELRILACVHSMDNVSGTINLLNLSNPTKQSPLRVFALHLVELTGSASAMLIVHDTSNNSSSTYNRIENSQSDKIINAFEAFENQSAGISVHPLTALSPFISMHEDVCNLAEDKHIAFMILPFHNQALFDSDSNHTTSSLREVNSNILVNAPCSVGIFMDKGLRKSDVHGRQHVVMVFIGGPDDREALAFAWRMLGHPLVQLTVLQLHSTHINVKEKDIEYSKYNEERQRQLDAEFVNEFRLQTAGEQNVNYYEKVVNSGEETTDALREMEVQKVDLYIVGREVTASAATASLLDWSECMVIGAIGEWLVFSDFARGSVLVVQHYLGDDGDVGAASMRGSKHGFALNFNSFHVLH